MALSTALEEMVKMQMEMNQLCSNLNYKADLYAAEKRRNQSNHLLEISEHKDRSSHEGQPYKGIQNTALIQMGKYSTPPSP